MVTTALQSESARHNDLGLKSEGWRLYADFRHQKSKWDAISYSPEYRNGDLPEHLDKEMCDATADALNAYLLSPAEDMAAFVTKLRVFRDEDIIDGWGKGREIVQALLEDAKRLAH